jgi:hypothetical protein
MENLNKTSPIDETTLNLIGIYLSICFLLCVSLNFLILLIFYKYKELRIPLNIFIITISACNLIASIQFPFEIYSNFQHKYFTILLFRHKFEKNKIIKNIFSG